MFTQEHVNQIFRKTLAYASSNKEMKPISGYQRSFGVSGRMPVVKLTSTGTIKEKNKAEREHTFNWCLPYVPAMTSDCVAGFSVTSMHNDTTKLGVNGKKQKDQFVTVVNFQTDGNDKNIGVKFKYDTETRFSAGINRAQKSSMAKMVEYGFDSELAYEYFETIKKWYQVFERKHKRNYDASGNEIWEGKVGFGVAAHRHVNELASNAFSFALFDVDQYGRTFISREYIFIGDIVLLIKNDETTGFKFIKDKHGVRTSCVMNISSFATSKIDDEENVKKFRLYSLSEHDIESALKSKVSGKRVTAKPMMDNTFGDNQIEIERPVIEEPEQVEHVEQVEVEQLEQVKIEEKEVQPEQSIIQPIKMPAKRGSIFSRVKYEPIKSDILTIDDETIALRNAERNETTANTKYHEETDLPEYEFGEHNFRY